MMYDMRQEANEFVADSLAEARAKAAEFYGTEESKLRIVVPPAGEIYGVAGRTVIVAIPEGISVRSPRRGNGGDQAEDRGPRRDQREGRGGSAGGGGRNRSDRGDRGAARGRGGARGGRGERGEDRERGRGGRGEGRERFEAPPPVAVEGSKGTAKGKIGPIGEFLRGAVELMKLGSFEIAESSEGDFLIYQLTGPAADALQGGDGRATDALQLVANQVSMRQNDDSPRIVVDVEGGGDEREQTLTRLADRAVKRARDTGRSIALDPMNGRDRRAVHIAVRDEEGVATMSIGEGRYRQVLIVPEGAPEYEDAVADSEGS